MLFDEYGDYCGCVIVQDALITPASVNGVPFYDALDEVVPDDLDDVIDCCVYDAHYHCYLVHTMDTVPSPWLIISNDPDYKSLHL